MSDFKDELVIVSDIHLKTCQDSRARKLLAMIERIDPNQVKYFILLGDIFDFCFAASSYFKSKFQEVGDSLSRLSERGVKVYFFQGNHEFALNEFSWPGVTFVLERSIVLEISDGRSIFLSHGDRIGARWHYEIYLSLTRSRVFRLLALMCPQKYLDRLCLKISEKSRQSSLDQRIPHRRILENIVDKIKSTEATYAVVGHYHVPYQIEIPTGQKIFCLKSWDEPNALGFTDKSVVRYTSIDKLKGDASQVAKPQSFIPQR